MNVTSSARLFPSRHGRAPRHAPWLAAALLVAVACADDPFEARVHAAEGEALALQGAAPVQVPAPATVGELPEGMRRWRHPLGAQFVLPSDYATEPVGGSCRFVPPGVKRRDEEPRVAAHFLFLPAPDITTVASREFTAAADGELSALAASARRLSSGEKIALADREAVVLRYSTAENGVAGRADVYATLHEGLAVGLLVVGYREEVEAHAAAMDALFASLRFVAPQHDSALAATWTRGESYVSGGFSMATEERLVLRADGRYTRSSQAAGGDASNSFDSDGDVESGRWFGGEGALVLCADGGAAIGFTWRVVDGTLVLHDVQGRRTLWE